jgi:hypothetical protein
MIWTILDILIYVALLLALTMLGDVFCKQIVKLAQVKTPSEAKTASATTPEEEESPRLRAGRVIGRLERTLILLGLAAHSWEVLVAVIALKTVARYNELDKQIAAEYFLIGSLASILWALVITMIALGFDTSFGFNLSVWLRANTGIASG